MKIAFYSGTINKEYAKRIINLLQTHAPHHQYDHYSSGQDVDLLHCLAPNGSIAFIGNASRSVVTLSDLRFVVSPEIFTLKERLFVLPLYRYHCRHAARLIAHDTLAKRCLVEKLGVEERRVEICSRPYACKAEGGEVSNRALLEVRERFDLPDSYIFVVGDIDTMHGHTTILHSVFEQHLELNVVIYGRRTTHSDVLLRVVRDFDAADRVQFIYECGDSDLLSLYRMAMVVIYFPTHSSSVAPIVEGLHCSSPMILSDTPLNRETAGQAALYVRPYDVGALTSAIKSVIYNESFRGQLMAQCWAEAKRYSEKGVAEQLAKIYEGV